MMFLQNFIRSLLVLIMLGGGLVIVSPGIAHAAQNEETLQDLVNLSLKDLSEITVSTASKKDEDLTSAPGIATVITAEDIKRYGANNLFDVLRRLPNLDIIAPQLLPTGIGPNIRGQTPGISSNHVLTLIDGRPFRESLLGGWVNAVYQAMPVEMVERIEMIRGPGSVLYGSNAFAGVINIITKKPDDAADHETFLSAGFGTDQTHTQDATYRHYDAVNDLRISAGIKAFTSQGWEYDVVDRAGVPGSEDIGQDNVGLFGRLEYKNLTITAFDGDIRSDAFGTLLFRPIGFHKQDRHFVDVGYEQPLWGDWKSNINVTFNGFGNFIFAANSVVSQNEFNDVLYEISVDGSIGEDIHLQVGATYDDRDGRIGTEKFDEAQEGYYVQTEYTPLDWLKFTGGLQFNRPESFSSYDISPRAAVITHFTPNIGMKLLYGEAFRTPTAGEIRLNVPGVIGNPDLESEEATTKEVQFFYNTPKSYYALTYYESRSENIIRSAPNPNAPPPITFLGDNIYEYEGIEFEGKYLFDNNLEIQGSFTYQVGEDIATGDDNITLAPHFMFKVGASYASDNGYTIGVFNQHIRDQSGVPESAPPTARPNPAADNYSLLTANVVVDLNRVFELPAAAPEMSFSLYGDNLLDEDIYAPTPNAGVPINTTPIYGGRAFLGRLNIRF